jgi:hypothetical protein
LKFSYNGRNGTIAGLRHLQHGCGLRA